MKKCTYVQYYLSNSILFRNPYSVLKYIQYLLYLLHFHAKAPMYLYGGNKHACSRKNNAMPL